MEQKRRAMIRYIFPAVGGLFMTYLYNVMDGIFVGRGVGSAGLGAVNIGVPFITFVVAIAATFPMGGATVVAIRIGRGDEEGANQAFMVSLSLTLLVSVALMFVGMVFAGPIVDFSGGAKLSGEMRRMAVDYLFYYSAFSIPMLVSTCLSVFVRNDGSPALSFAGMCTGAAANIFLDWLFIFPLGMGVIGAAIASGLGQISAVLGLSLHFIRKQGILRIRLTSAKLGLIGKICKRGIPEAVSQLNTPVTAFCYNLVLAHLIGDIGVSTFSVLSFIYSLANAIFSGVAQGLQPLWGNNYGKQDTRELTALFRCGMAVNSLLSLLVYLLLFLFDEPVIRIFNQNEDLVQAASQALPVFGLSFVPMAVNLIYTAFLYSTKRTVQADAVAVCRGIFFKSAAIFLLPAIWGDTYLWAAPLLAEGATLAVACVLKNAFRVSFPAGRTFSVHEEN